MSLEQELRGLKKAYRYGVCFDEPSKTSCTRPTSPLTSRTLIPCGWKEDFVRMSLMIPRVSLVDPWSFFRTIAASTPGRTFFRYCPFMRI